MDEAAKACPAAIAGLAGAAKSEGQRQEAVELCIRALNAAEHPLVKAACWNNLGSMLAEMGQRPKAEACFRESIKINNRMTDVWHNLALCCKWRNDVPQALKCINRAISLSPNNHQAHFSKGVMQLVSGNLEEGFRNYEARFLKQTKGCHKMVSRKPEWTGRIEPGKRVFVYCEQGAGDTVMMARYALWMHARGMDVSIGVQPGLVRLFQTLECFSHVVGEGQAPPEFDYHIPTMSLPRVHGTTLQTIPVGSYLHSSAPKDFGPGFHVGIAWAGSIDHVDDHLRSTELEQWAPILETPGVALHSLQVGPRCLDLDLQSGWPINDLGGLLGDYLDTVNVIAGLDLVIAVDTSVVHLAGAMGVPCWVLLPFAPDWRWLLNRSDSLWYPSLRLFRQTGFREWESVISSVAHSLKEYQQVTVNRRQGNGFGNGTPVAFDKV